MCHTHGTLRFLKNLSPERVLYLLKEYVAQFYPIHVTRKAVMKEASQELRLRPPPFRQNDVDPLHYLSVQFTFRQVMQTGGGVKIVPPLHFEDRIEDDMERIDGDHIDT